MTKQHKVYLRAMVPIIYTVYVDADSPQEAHDKVSKDVAANGFGSDYWVYESQQQEVCHESADDLEVLPLEE